MASQNNEDENLDLKTEHHLYNFCLAICSTSTFPLLEVLKAVTTTTASTYWAFIYSVLQAVLHAFLLLTH